MEDFSGAVNGAEASTASASPAQANDDAASQVPNEGQASHEREDDQDDADLDQDDGEGDEEDSSSQEDGESAAASKREKFIPRERFDEVNQKAQESESKWQTAQAELDRLAAENSEVREAANLGIADVAQYRAITQEGKQYGFPDAASYLTALQQRQQAQAEINEIADRPDMDEDGKRELILAKQTNLQAQQQLMQSLAMQQEMQKQVMETTLTHAREELGVKNLPPELEKVLRQSAPDVVRTTVASFKSLIKQRTDEEVAKYAAAKGSDNSRQVPGGRGGSPPPTSSGNADFRTTSYADLLRPARRK